MRTRTETTTTNISTQLHHDKRVLSQHIREYANTSCALTASVCTSGTSVRECRNHLSKCDSTAFRHGAVLVSF